MNIIILTAAYPPMTNSGALQVNDLAHGLAYDGHQSIVIFPDAKITNKISFVLNKNLLEIRVKYLKCCLQIEDIVVETKC